MATNFVFLRKSKFSLEIISFLRNGNFSLRGRASFIRYLLCVCVGIHFVFLRK